jgi:hypothetical protein
MRNPWTRFVAVVIGMLLCGAAQCQTKASREPSLPESLSWMEDTLKASEGNNTVIHRPFPQPYTSDWVRDHLDPYHLESITKFSHTGCRVEFDVDVTNNDMGSLGISVFEHDVDTLDLKDIDPTSIRVQDACASFDTPSGPTKGWNCEDEQGKFVIFQTSNAKAKIHEESRSSVGRSLYSDYHKDDPTKTQGDILDELCKGMPGNIAYCGQPEHKEKPKDETQSQLGFSTPEYAARFAKALKHAVILCGGKPSYF